MREHALRTGSSYQERGDKRNNPNKPRQASGPRSKRSVNLGRLGDELGLDVLGASLGLSEQALKVLVDGRDHVREEQYSAHLSHRLVELGIPMSWLERPYAAILPEYLRILKERAAKSRNKAPIRRVNLTRLTKAFDGRTEVLADALEMVPSSVTNVAEGRLDFDDQRFGHVNPRLVRAGFPDGWLEQPEPELTDAMLEALEQLATDDYERHFEHEEDTVQQTIGQAFVSPQPAQVAEKSVQRAAAFVDTTKKESMMVTPSPQQPQRPGATQEAPSFHQPEFNAAGVPGAAPLTHPGKITRSVLMAGRKIATDATQITPAPASAEAPVPPQSTGTLSLPKTEQTTAPQAPERRQSARGTITKEASIARANALEQLLEGARRGVKVTLWRDLLNSSLPFWGNIRRGAVLFRDDLASAAEQAMGLPQGWLDNPSFPPPSLAAWLNDPNAPLPVVSGVTPPSAPTEASGQAAEPPVAKTKRPYVKKAVPAPTVVMAQGHIPAPVPAPVPSGPLAAEPAPLVASAPSVEAPSPNVPAATPAPLVSAAVASQGAPGPLCQALMSILSRMAVEGTFTEQDALSMITNLMAKR